MHLAALAALAFPLLMPGPVAPDSPGMTVRSPETAKATVVLAGGCFWGVEAIYEHVRGVKSVVSGYAVAATAATDEPTMQPARPGYVEAVRIEYDPGTISYDRLLEIFFLVAHDPTQRDRQGPDIGPEYRSVILVASDAERGAATAYRDSLESAEVFPRPIVTEVAPLKSFKVAEWYHQDYVARNPRAQYVILNDLPKLEELRRRFPDLYRAGS
jgi:peptide-methionine (S)-S-oxide reductase